MSLLTRIALFTGSGFGVGFIPGAPGTWGSLLALPLVWLCYSYGGLSLVIALTLLSCAASWLSTNRFEAVHGSDPGPLVMDEIAGQSLCLLLLFLWGLDGAATYLAGFLFFRLFDITKILGADAIQNLGGGAGVLLDDLLAGIYAHLAAGLVIVILL